MQNVASYIGEYIGAYGEALFERGLDELIFRAACWATGTQMVWFSTGANKYINRELNDESREQNQITDSEQKPDFDFDREDTSNSTEGSTSELVKWTWT